MAGIKRRSFIRGIGCGTLSLAASLHLSGSGFAVAEGSRKKVKVGQIGTAHAHASGKMATFRKLVDDYEVVGIVEPDPRRRKAVENDRAYRGLKWMTEEQLLNIPGLVAVAVETAVKHLLPVAARCVDAGMHLHLDKPAGESLGEFQKVLDAAAGKNLTVQMGYMYRNNPAFQLCFKAVREGWLGQVFELHGVMSKAVGQQTRKHLAEYPGGSMFELGCHLIDALVKVLGKPDKTTPYVRRTRPDQDDLADNQLAVFEYPKATATIRSTLVEVQGQRRRQFVVCGDEGTVDIRPLEPPKLLLALSRPRGGYKAGYQEVRLPSMPGRYDDQLATLAAIIRGEKESDYPPSHDLAVQQAVLEAGGLAIS